MGEGLGSDGKPRGLHERRPDEGTARRPALLGWLIRVILPALLLTLPAALLVRAEAPQVRYEELAESIRGPVWLEHGLVYDGVSTNLGWYAFLVAVYRTFGFTLTTAKWARVALLAASLCALSTLLHRHLRAGPAAAALTAFALSPTLLFFNRLTTSYGTDLLLLPVCLLLLDELWRRSRPGEATAPGAAEAGASPGAGSPTTAAALGALAMTAAMTYPAFVPAAPFLAAWLVAAAPARRRARHALAAGVGFTAPLVAGALVLRHPSSLFWSPVERAGIFRGGAVGWSGDWGVLRSNLERLGHDLFDRGSSYYFELRAVEFHGWLGRAGFAAVAALAIATAWRVREARAPLATALAAALLAALSTAAAGGPPGLRRATVVVAAFYAVVAVLWAARERCVANLWARTAVAAGLLLVPVHHAVAYADQLDQARRPVWGRERVWFSIAATPQAALDHWLERTEGGEPLDCRSVPTPGRQTCRYDYIFAVIDGARRWNGGAPIEVRAIDPRDGRVVTLAPEVWRTLAPPPVHSRRRRRAS